VKKTIENMEHLEQIERDLLEQVDKVATLGEYFAWAERCDEFIEQLEERSRQASAALDRK